MEAASQDLTVLTPASQDASSLDIWKHLEIFSTGGLLDLELGFFFFLMIPLCFSFIFIDTPLIKCLTRSTIQHIPLLPCRKAWFSWSEMNKRRPNAKRRLSLNERGA